MVCLLKLIKALSEGRIGSVEVGEVVTAF